MSNKCSYNNETTMKEAGNVDGETVNSEDNKQQELEVSIRDYLILNEIR